MKRLGVNTAWCKGCGICVTFCPKQVLGMEKGKVKILDEAKCVRCGMCENLCPDFSVFLYEEEAGANG